MTPEGYKTARQNSGISVLDNWCRAIGISEDTHKSISSGRMAVSEAVENRIRDYFAEVESRAQTLQDALSDKLKECSVTRDTSTFDISIAFPDGRNFKAKHLGVDTMNGWGVYNVEFGRGREPLLLLHALSPLWKRKSDSKKFHWYMWRGPFQGTQSYWNDVDSDLLRQCFKE